MAQAHYTDARGVEKVGEIVHISDHGGHDITYRIQDDTGYIDMVPGDKVGENVR